MGNLNTILAAILCASAPLASSEPREVKSEIAQTQITLGKEVVSSLREAYEKGEYADFLKQMDASYRQALAENELDGLIQMRQKEIPSDFGAKWEEKFTALQKQKNQDLLNALSDKDHSLFAEKVRSLAANISTPEQEKAILRLHSLVQKAPGTGANEDENALIAIDLEYEYKLLHAAAPAGDTQEQFARQMALRMEKMDKMVQASHSFQDLSLKQAVGLAAANLDARLARNLDGADLNAFTKGKVKPTNATEQKVADILSSYQGQFNDLMKEIDRANH